MTDNLQLQTARLTNASAGNLLDNSIADIENAMATVFGITADSPVSQVMSISSAGNVTMIGDLTLSGAPTADLHASTKAYADANTGGGGGITHKIEVILSTDELIAWNTEDALINWDYAVFEDGDSTQWDSGAPSKIYCRESGDYLIYGQIEVYQDYNTYDGFSIDLYKDGGKIHDAVVSGITFESIGAFYHFSILYSLTDGEYLEFKANNYAVYDNLELKAAHTSAWTGGTIVGMMKVG